MFQRIRCMIIKEFTQVFRDARLRSILFVVPIFQILIFGYAVTTDVDNVSTIFIDDDHTPASREVIDTFVQSGYFVAEESLGAKDAYNKLDQGAVLAIVHIPYGFFEKISHGHPAPLQVIVDGTDANSARIIQGYLEKLQKQLSMEFSLNTTTLPGVEVESRSWFNDNLESKNFYIPGIISTIMTLVTLTMTSMSIVREKEIGTIEQILVTPIRKIEFILGKTIPFSCIAYFDVILIILVATLWFEVPLRGSIPLLFLAVTFYLLTILSLGFFISTISQTQQQAMMVTFFFYFPMVLLSGFLFPIYNMPLAVKWFTYLNPLTYFIHVIRSLFLKGVGLEILWPQIVILAMMSFVTITLVSTRFRKTMA